MLFRILLRKLGIARSSSSRWDLLQGIQERVGAYNEKQEKIIGEQTGSMITLHKLNQQELSINTAQIQSIEPVGSNTLIIFSSGNRIIVLESAEQVHQLLKETADNDCTKRNKGDA